MTSMLSWFADRDAGREPRRLAVERDSGRLADHQRAAQRVLREGALHLSGGRSGDAGGGRESGDEAEHGGSVRAARRSEEARGGEGDGDLVALQGLEPRTCGL